MRHVRPLIASVAVHGGLVALMLAPAVPARPAAPELPEIGVGGAKDELVVPGEIISVDDPAASSAPPVCIFRGGPDTVIRCGPENFDDPPSPPMAPPPPLLENDLVLYPLSVPLRFGALPGEGASLFGSDGRPIVPRRRPETRPFGEPSPSASKKPRPSP